MSRATERRARKFMNQVNAAKLRAANGKASKRDVDMLERYQRESRGLDGYSGESRANGSSSASSAITTTSKHTPNKHDSAFLFRTIQPKDEHVFHCEESGEVTGECPLKPPVPDIYIPSIMWDTFLKLAKDIKTEWIVLLKGKLDKVDNKPAYLIEGYYFPPQTAGPSHVDIPTGVNPKAGTIGALHSHVGMGVFFSGTDLAHSNWPVEIVINNREEYKSVSRFQLKCGEWSKRDSTVFITGERANSKVMEAIKTAFHQGSMLEKGLAKPTPSQVTSQPTPSKTETTQTNGGSGGASSSSSLFTNPSPRDNPNNSRLCNCGHTFGDHYRTPFAMLNFPAGVAAGMCLEETCKCSMFSEKDNKTSLMGDGSNRPLTELERQSIINADSKEVDITTEARQLEFPVGLDNDSPDDTLSEETCPTCEGDKYVAYTDGVRTITRICKDCNGDGLSSLGKIRLAEMAKEMESN